MDAGRSVRVGCCGLRSAASTGAAGSASKSSPANLRRITGLREMPCGNLRQLEEDAHGECGARSERAPGSRARGFLTAECVGDVLAERCCVCLRQPLEAAVLHEDWR